MLIKPTHSRYTPSAAERFQLKLNAHYAKHHIEPPRFVQWRSGDLRWKLERDKNQLGLYDSLKHCPVKQGVIEGARKIGKTFLFGDIALETAEQNPGKQINWCSGTVKAARGILVPVLEEISRDAPVECRGHFDSATSQWRMPNGAFIQIFGAETKRDCERGRGPSSILNIIDEAGFIDLLEYLVDSIFSPQLRRVKRVPGTFVGMTLLCSTTPYTPTHPFCTIADGAQATKSYFRRTIYDSGFESLEEIEAYIAEEAAKKNMTVAAFKQTSTFRREYMSERVVDTEAVVFPEFSAVEDKVVQEWPRPIGFDQFIYKRTSVDPGGTRDPTGILSGYVDFTNAKVVIEGERLLMRPTTDEIAVAVKELEAELWGPPPIPTPGQAYKDRDRVSRRVDDPTGRVCLDLWELNRLQVAQAVKNDRNASIGLIRTWLVDGTLIIHPRCVILRRQLRTALHNKTKKDFERNSEGHCDVAASLMYFCRDLSLTTNPYPNDFDQLTGRTMPDHHPLAARREQMGQHRNANGLAGAILSGNRFVQRQLGRK